MIAAETKSTATAGPRSPKRGPSQDHAFAAPGWHSAETSAKASESCADIENVRLWHGRQSGAGVHPHAKQSALGKARKTGGPPDLAGLSCCPVTHPAFASSASSIVHNADQTCRSRRSGNEETKATSPRWRPAPPLGRCRPGQAMTLRRFSLPSRVSVDEGCVQARRKTPGDIKEASPAALARARVLSTTDADFLARVTRTHRCRWCSNSRGIPTSTCAPTWHGNV